MLIITLISNFGTFLLYMTTCIVAIVAFREHHSFHGFKHMFVPAFGLLANLGCMLFYVFGPSFVAGMSPAEPRYCPWFRLALDHHRSRLFEDDQQIERKGDHTNIQTTNRLSQITGAIHPGAAGLFLCMGGQPHLYPPTQT